MVVAMILNGIRIMIVFVYKKSCSLTIVSIEQKKL